MAKAKAKRTVAAEVVPPAGEPKTAEPLAPEKVHELFGAHGPYDIPSRPLALSGFVTFWDPGVSIRGVLRKYRDLFYLKDFADKFVGATDGWRWKQVRLNAAAVGRPFAEQRTELRVGEPPAAREVVVFLALLFLTTGERLATLPQRCRDASDSGRRAYVGFGEFGFDIGNVSDGWASPGIGLAEIVVAPRKK